MFSISIIMFSIGFYRLKYENEKFSDLWALFLLGTMVAIPGFFYGFILIMIFL